MEAYQERVQLEKNELDAKWNKLREFILTDTFKQLSYTEQALLTVQDFLMYQYSEILEARIDLWHAPKDLQ